MRADLPSPMRKPLLLILFLFFLAVAAGAILVGTRQLKAPVLISRAAPAKIRFEEQTHNLGDLQQGIQAPFVFKIYNMGGSPLLLKNVSTSCTCALLDLKDKSIDPGKVGNLNVVVDTSTKLGKLRETISLVSNDPKRPKSILYVTGNILPKADTGNTEDASPEKTP